VTTFFQLSDTHLLADAAPLYGTVASTTGLEHALQRIRESGVQPAGILVSGDIADDGTPDAYRAARRMLDALATDVGAPVIAVNGNHDDRALFTDILLVDGARIDRVIELDGVRIIALDSTVDGEDGGHLDVWQLAWLRSVLRTAAPVTTLLLLHHPPITAPMPNLAGMMLANRGELAAILRGSDVGMVLAGHVHYAGAGSCGGVPVWVSPAPAARSDTTPPGGLARIAHGGGFSRIDVIDGEVIASALPTEPSETALDFAPFLASGTSPSSRAPG
jgi:3',5'-cyclic-AMP phosphodiesterase